MTQKKITTLLISLLLGFLSIAQEKKVEIHELRVNMYMVVYDWPSRITLSVAEDGILMVDSGLKDNISIIYDAIAKKFNNKPIKYVISTHSHGDHTGGIPFLLEKGTLNIAHDYVKEVMNQLYYVDEIGNETRDTINGKPKRDFQSHELPQITISDRMTLEFNKEAIELIHVPDAHSKGDLLVWFKDKNVIAMGDNYFGDAYTYSQSFEGMIKAHEITLQLINEETIIVPGHGVKSSKKELALYLKMLKDVSNIIKTKIKQGKTLDEVTNDSSITEKYDEKYGQLFMSGKLFREQIYKEYSPEIF